MQNTFGHSFSKNTPSTWNTLEQLWDASSQFSTSSLCSSPSRLSFRQLWKIYNALFCRFSVVLQSYFLTSSHRLSITTAVKRYNNLQQQQQYHLYSHWPSQQLAKGPLRACQEDWGAALAAAFVVARWTGPDPEQRSPPNWEAPWVTHSNYAPRHNGCGWFLYVKVRDFT